VTVVPLHQDPAVQAPPHDLQAEQAVIGAVLISDRVLDPVRVDEALTATCFYRDQHRLIWQAIETLADHGDPVDTLTVAGALRDHGHSEPAKAVDQLSAAAPSVTNARSYARRVVDAWRWRTRMSAHYAAHELAAHAGQHDHQATVWTNEMSEDELIARHVQRTTGIASDDVLDRTADPADTAIAVKQLPFGVVPCPGWPADEIARHIRHVAPDLAVVDHFHQLPGTSEPKAAEHAVQVLTSAAAQAGTHLVIVSQLNHLRDREAERPDPALRDLKSTGALQDLPNNVLLLRRKQESDKDSGETWLSDDAVLHVAKQRGAPCPLYQSVFISPPRMRVVEAMFR
jgi:replicative DNA helicase